MMHYPGDHLVDESLSALVDGQLSADGARHARAHLDACSACQMRLDELRSVIDLLRQLPEVEPPRSFALGPRLLEAPPNVVRLRRWYTVARASAASLAAVFVALSASALYIDSQQAPARVPETLANRPQAAAPVPTAIVPSAPTVAARAAAPAPAAAIRPAAPAPTGADSDQIAAATSIGPLPTPVPTPTPTPSPTPLPAPPPRPVPAAQLDTAAPLRTAAALVGLLAVLTLLATLLVRHRLQSASRFVARLS